MVVDDRVEKQVLRSATQIQLQTGIYHYQTKVQKGQLIQILKAHPTIESLH